MSNRSWLPDSLIASMQRDRDAGMSNTEIAAKYGVSRYTVGDHTFSRDAKRIWAREWDAVRLRILNRYKKRGFWP